jgi:type II secretory pathway pseudopilin PulG
MKLLTADRRPPIDQARCPGFGRAVGDLRSGGFTMIEIALCLAIIGFALVSILLVLPSGMNTQRDTREETIIGQDAAVLLEAIRDGAEGMDDLTNYVYGVTNYWTVYKPDGTPNYSGIDGYSYTGASLNGTSQPYYSLTNGARIIGLLSAPEFRNGNLPISSTFNTSYTSNHIIAYIRSVSGLAAEKPPQNNQIMQEDTFSYRVLCVNAPVAADTNVLDKSSSFYSAYNNQLAGNLRELRLLFMWPQLPNGNVGAFRQNFRTSIAGQLLYNPTNDTYLYQSQSFTNAP